jgi:hypothetical protein
MGNSYRIKALKLINTSHYLFYINIIYYIGAEGRKSTIIIK